MLMHSFTKREKIILIIAAIALVIGFYFLVIHYPVKTRLAEIEAEKLTVEDERMVADIKLASYNKMKNELDEIFAMPAEEITYMPQYDNAATLMSILDGIIPRSEYSISQSVSQEGNIAARTVNFNFVADDYMQAKQILGKLQSTGYRCLMQNLTIAPGDGSVTGKNVKVSGNIVFYELVN